MCQAGLVENFLVVVDCKGIGLTNLPFGAVRAVITSMTTLFKNKAKAFFCLNCSLGFNLGWSGIKPFLTKSVIEKINFSA
jgi:hypothetical protein